MSNSTTDVLYPSNSSDSDASVTTSNITDVFDVSTFAGEDGPPRYQPWQAVLISLILICVILCTIIGNGLVVLAICMVRKLRVPYNYLLVSLAAADMSVAIFVMPLALLNEIQGEWILGETVCDMWTSSDVLLCTASILNLCMISVDRYFAITRPLQYAAKRTPKRMLLIVFIVWISSALISIPPLFGWKEKHPPGQCMVSQNIWYQLYATIGAFYLPCAVMLVLYMKIFLAARKISREEAKAYRALSVYKTEDSNGDVLEKTRKSKLRGHITKFRERISMHHGSKGSEDSHFARETKAAKTLGVIMGCFILCWLPFFLLAIVAPLCQEACDIPVGVFSLFLWLGYANSTCNPVIYATLNREFRKPFHDLLCFR